jgi:hypothetical protein
MSAHNTDDRGTKPSGVLNHTQNEMVSSRGPVVSEPHEGHGGTRFEGGDAKAGMVITSLVIIGGTLLIVFAMTVGIQRLLEKANPPGELPSAVAPARVVPPEPQLEVHPWDLLPDLRAREDQILNNYGKDANGHVHIPIGRAIDAVTARLSIAPGAPQGIMTPGGEGRNFAGSLQNMPDAYRKPQIQGEIRKHAQ